MTKRKSIEEIVNGLRVNQGEFTATGFISVSVLLRKLVVI